MVTEVIGTLATINLLSVRYGSVAVNYFALSKLLPLLLFILMGLFSSSQRTSRGCST